MSFKVQHDDKLRMNFKKAGNGFQSDNICGDRYSPCFYICNEIAIDNYLNQGLPPLHSRALALFDCLEHKVN